METTNSRLQYIFEWGSSWYFHFFFSTSEKRPSEEKNVEKMEVDKYGHNSSLYYKHFSLDPIRPIGWSLWIEDHDNVDAALRIMIMLEQKGLTIIVNFIFHSQIAPRLYN